jgi:hypothetical protein
MALVLQLVCLRNRLVSPLDETHSMPGRGFGFQGKAHGSLKETLEMCLAAWLLFMLTFSIIPLHQFVTNLKIYLH